ncbi:MAG: glycogen/starch/alpha-glucan phosphorylase [Candidatus Ancillula sp.]|jgi:starch phosphorylase|nr:glycogen/starch/alpha-glucan phosphorylase [Candidatus Ancillula sp.]
MSNYNVSNQAFDPISPINAEPTDELVSVFTHHFLSELRFGQGTDLDRGSLYDFYHALVRTVRNYLIKRWDATFDAMKSTSNGGTTAGDTRVVAYLSAEFLLGKQLDNALLSTGLCQISRTAIEQLGLDYDAIVECEVEPGLGNGGLGRLAACYIDSLATLSIPAIGYGIRYEYGIFTQKFEENKQVEYPDKWLEFGNNWEISHPERFQIVSFGGHVEGYTDADGRDRRRWAPSWQVHAVPNDWLVPGYQTDNVNTLRLWSSKATNSFSLVNFNVGDYTAAVTNQIKAENISKVLYPEDSTQQGKELRLEQQYFFVAASIKDLLQNRFGSVEKTEDNPTGIPLDADLSRIPELITFQLNDTHPVIGIPELLRILVDERGWEFEPAFEIVRRTFNYTCHTLLPEALEVWSADLMWSLLPRHMELIEQINNWYLANVRAVGRNPEDTRITEEQAEEMSIITGEDFHANAVHMAHLAVVGSSKVNGVAELHSQLLKDKTLKNFSDYEPEKFTNVTNGITPRRFIKISNPRLTNLIDEHIDGEWINNLHRLSELERLADNEYFLNRLSDVKYQNKLELIELLKARDGIELNPDAIFDVMVKRLHEYKRQTLKILHVIALYAGVKNGTIKVEDIYPRTVIFGAKAAPGYKMAKEIIYLINSVAEKINSVPELKGRLTIVFPANYNVTLASKLIPAADLSEQISLAGKEASGTGNMKFMQSGGLTVGTLDGANVEICRLAGNDNFYLFGMKEPEVEELFANGYSPYSFYENNPILKSAIDLISSGEFSSDDGSTFANVVNNLLNIDSYAVLADFQSYWDIQKVIEQEHDNKLLWSKKSLLNIARSGYFSSDRSIQDYLERIWHSKPLKINIQSWASAAGGHL